MEKLNGKFAYRYLVFDSELQHGEGGVSLPREKQIEKNCNKLKNMLEFFNNESDQGKLYVNYPMMESYRDCDAFFDEGYKDRTVALDLLSKYKEQVGKRKLSKVHTDKIDKEDIFIVMLLGERNIEKRRSEIERDHSSASVERDTS